MKSGRKRIICTVWDGTMVLPYVPLADFTRELDPRYFLQCNRSTVVNRRFISAVDTVEQLCFPEEEFWDIRYRKSNQTRLFKQIQGRLAGSLICRNLFAVFSGSDTYIDT